MAKKKSTRHVSGNPDLLPDPIIMFQQFDPKPEDSPERALLRAVMTEAINTVRRSPRNSQPWREAYEWFYEEGAEDVMAFVTICEAFNIAPDAARRKIFEGTAPLRGMRSTSSTEASYKYHKRRSRQNGRFVG